MLQGAFVVSVILAFFGCCSEWVFGPYSMGGYGPGVAASGFIGSMATVGFVFHPMGRNTRR